MKKLFPGLMVCAGLMAGNSALAQDDVGELIKSSPQDATKLAQAYLNPLFKGFGIGLNSGWNNTGRAKNTGRFELRVGFTGAFIPKTDKSFNVTQLGLSNNIRLEPNQNPNAPTLGGDSDNGPLMGVYYNNQRTQTFNLPGGTNVPFVPAPQLQATVGLPKGIDVTLRAMPKVDLGDAGTLSMIGGGIKVDVLPLLLSKKADRILPVDLGVALGYTQLNYKLPLDVENPSGSANDPNQSIDAKFSGINTEIILSKQLLFFTPFLSVGYNSAKTDVGLKGKYEFVSGVNNLGQPTYTTHTDPVSIKSNDISGFRSNVGFQLKMAFLRLYASYSVAEYNAVNAGIGIGIGK